jgi:hypothetical protein
MKNSYKNSTSYYSFDFQPRFSFGVGEFWLLGDKKTKANATHENDFCEKRTPKSLDLHDFSKSPYLDNKFQEVYFPVCPVAKIGLIPLVDGH